MDWTSSRCSVGGDASGASTEAWEVRLAVLVVTGWTSADDVPVLAVDAGSPSPACLPRLPPHVSSDSRSPYGWPPNRCAVPIRTPAELPIRLHELNVRFCLGQEVSPVESASGLVGMEQKLLDLMRCEMADLARDVDDSYFAAYREALFRLLRFQVHETQDDPLVCLFVLHTDLIPEYAWKQTLQDLEERLTPKMKACLDLGTAVRQVVFVGDLEAHQEELGGIGNILKASGKYPLPIAIDLREHAGADEGAAGGTGGTGGAAPPTAHGGAFDVASFVEALCSACLLPHIESRIREHEVVISASRRGLKNQLKSFLFRKAPSDPSLALGDGGEGLGRSGHAPELSGTFGPLRADSVEAAMRSQSDLLMLVGDYATATATLKLLSSDLKSDKLHLHYASSQEALAMVTVFGGGSVSAAIMYMKEAFLRYSGIVEAERGLSKSLAAIYCTRVALQWVDLLACLNRLSDASWIAMRAHFHESNARAAFLLEYAAHFLLLQRPAKERKCAFYLVLAALRYGQANESSLAFIAHQKAIGMLEGKGWDILEEHVHEALDHECLARGDNAKALEHAVAMIQCFSLPSQLQESHMARMLDVFVKVAEAGGTGSLPAPVPMGVPSLDTSHTSVICAGSHDYYDDTSRKTSTRVWKDMELDFPRTKLVAAHGRDKSGVPGHGSACVGEDILVKIPVFNPLKIALDIAEIELICEVRGAMGVANGHAPGARQLADGPTDQLTLSKTRMFLGPGEEDVLELRCRPETPASVSILGVRWTLGGVPCEAKFEPRVSKWALEPELRPCRGGPVDIEVMPPMPRLSIAFSPEACPDRMLVGELVRCELLLSNVGSTDLHHVECVVSSNIFLEGTEQRGEAEACRWFRDLSIAVGESRTVNVFLRPDQAGHQDFNMVWRYLPLHKETEAGAGANMAPNTAPRFLRFSKSVVVEPSLLDSQALVVDHAAEDDTDMVCFQARTKRDRSIQLDSLIICTSGEARTFDLRGISALPSSGSPTHQQDGGSASFEFDQRLSSGKYSAELASELTAAEAHFLPTSDQLQRSCGIVRWYTDDQTARKAAGYTVFHLTRSTDTQAGLRGTVVAQLIAPATLQHNFASGPLSVNVELQIQSKINSEPVDVTWLIGSTPLGAPRRQTSRDGVGSRAVATSRVGWSCEKCGIQPDTKPDEKRFVILEAVARQPGTLQLDTVYVQWHSRANPSISGSTTLPPVLITVTNARPNVGNPTSTTRAAAMTPAMAQTR